LTLRNPKDSPSGLLRSRWLLWLGVGTAEAAGLAAASIALARGYRFLAVIAFLMGVAGLCLLAWERCRQLRELLYATGRGETLAIARALDRSLSAVVDRARTEAAQTPEPYLDAELDRWEQEFLTAFRARPILPRLAGRLAVGTAAACVAVLLLLSLLAMSLAAGSCAGGVCEAIYDHSCITGTGAGMGRLTSIAMHFVYYQSAGLFNLTGDLHHPVTRAAQALSVVTTLTWLFFLIGGLCSMVSVLLLMQQQLTPAILARQAVDCLRREIAESGDDPDSCRGVAPSGWA